MGDQPGNVVGMVNQAVKTALKNHENRRDSYDQEEANKATQELLAFATKK